MSEGRDGRPDDQKDFPEWQTELKDDDDDSRELSASEQDGQRGWRFDVFPGDEGAEREQRRDTDRYVLE